MESDLVPWKLASRSSATVMVPLIMLLLIKIWKKWNHGGPVNLPPGPKKLPIIGNMHLVSDPPFRSFRDLAKQYGPLMHLKLGEVDTIVVSSSEIAKEILKDNDPVFTNRIPITGLILKHFNQSGFRISTPSIIQVETIFATSHSGVGKESALV